MSNQLNLLRRGSSEVINGNMLTLPVGGGMLYVQPVYVQSSGDAKYPRLQRVLVSFGDKVGFAPTLEEALNQVFGGSSGAKLDGSAASPSPSASGSSGTSGASTGGSSASQSSELKQALTDASKAMTDADAAMKKGDWAAYGEAQKRLEAAVKKALEAEEAQSAASAKASASAAPSPSAAPSAAASAKPSASASASR